jgi:hypothetical protein
MLYDVGNIDGLSIYSRFVQGSIQQLPRWSYKGVPLPIFLIARLLAHHHDSRG